MAETCTVLPLAADEKGLMISAIRIPESCLESLNTPGVSVFLDWGTNEHVCYHAQQPRTTKAQDSDSNIQCVVTLPTQASTQL
jgi:hypothetical protein